MEIKNKRVESIFCGVLFCLLALMTGCDSDLKISSAQPTESDVIAAWVEQARESEVLSALVENGVLPSLSRLAETAHHLEEDVDVLCSSPSAEALQHAQAAWKDAYLAWRQAGSFLFGPAGSMDRNIGVWPANPVVLDAAVTDPELGHMLKQPDTRGFAGVEHLLFAPANAAEATTVGRIKQLKSCTEEIAQLTVEAKLQWESKYAATFLAAGDGNPYLLPADALSESYKELLNVTERTLRSRIGAPCGYFESGAAKPENVEAWLSQSTLAGFQATMNGFRLALAAGDGADLITLIATKDGLVETADPKLATDITRQIKRIEKTISGLRGKDMKAMLEKKSTRLKPLYKQFQMLQDQLVEASLVLELDAHRGLLELATDESK